MTENRHASATAPDQDLSWPSARFLFLSAAALVIGTQRAIRFSWLSDDAYISFRYARNLVRGLGLVFNAGERVEGYTNFLWTLLCALGLRLGVSAEAWSVFWGVARFMGALVLLYVFTRARRTQPAAAAVPIAALIGAFHRDWAIYATSGLETSLFTLLALAGFLLLASGSPSKGRAAAAGVALALAALARPDGVLFAAVGGLYVLWAGRPRFRVAVAYGASFLALWLPWIVWKLWYYGDIFPNSYYAKSANLAWYSQGLIYLGLYFLKYWILIVGAALAARAAWLVAVARLPADLETVVSFVRPVSLAAGFAVVYAWYVARVGGDFMFARLLVPATPFLLVLFELGLERLTSRVGVRLAVVGAAVIGMSASPSPVSSTRWIQGIADEWDFYRVENRDDQRRLGERLGRYFAGLPVRAAFVGGQAILIYHSDVPVGIESNAGLTDRFTAHQKLVRRGRPGHEKRPPYPYLLDRCKGHFLLTCDDEFADSLKAYIPLVRVGFDELEALILHWDPAVMSAVARRGARVDDFPAYLDRYIRELPHLPGDSVRVDYEKFRRFYFAHVNDPAREAAFRARLAAELPDPGPVQSRSTRPSGHRGELPVLPRLPGVAPPGRSATVRAPEGTEGSPAPHRRERAASPRSA